MDVHVIYPIKIIEALDYLNIFTKGIITHRYGMIVDKFNAAMETALLLDKSVFFNR